MSIQTLYWKHLSLNILFVFQALFVGTTAWDFFLTVVMHSTRSQIFSGLTAGTSMFIILPWILGIFILSVMLIAFMMDKDHEPMSSNVNFEYGGMMALYVILFFIGMFNPLIPWPIVVNYLINACWAWALIYLRSAIHYGMYLNKGEPAAWQT